MRHFWIGLLLVAGCSSDGNNGGDQGMPDVAIPGDLSASRDLAVSADLASADLATLDLRVPDDLTIAPDLTVRGDAGNGGQGANSSINCGNVTCTPPKGVCCRGQAFGQGSCIAPGDACGQLLWFCDNSADCANPGDVCCVTAQGAECRSVAACNQLMGRTGCQMMGDCPNNQMCCGVGPSPNYYCSGGPCPISRRKYKDDIHYLDDAERHHLHEALLAYPLSTWRYKQDVNRSEHLGFIIDDVVPSPAVSPGGETVDLYGYTTMAVAAIQEQARQIAELKRELASLRRELTPSARRRRHQ